jgi:hypothetical protein
MGNRSKYEIMVGLMCSSGFMLLICGVPGMILASLLEYLMGHMKLSEAVLFAGVMTGLIVFTGGILLWLGLYLARRLRRAKSVNSQP